MSLFHLYTHRGSYIIFTSELQRTETRHGHLGRIFEIRLLLHACAVILVRVYISFDDR